jgi:hypothetical protein
MGMAATPLCGAYLARRMKRFVIGAEILSTAA